MFELSEMQSKFRNLLFTIYSEEGIKAVCESISDVVINLHDQLTSEDEKDYLKGKLRRILEELE